jgi:hypothetical protein
MSLEELFVNLAILAVESKSTVGFFTLGGHPQQGYAVEDCCCCCCLDDGLKFDEACRKLCTAKNSAH